jgi:AraC-like DNA-binding protein
MVDVRTADARWAVLVVAALNAARIETDPILKTAGLTRRQVTNPDAKIPFHKHAALLTLAAEAMGDPYFTLHLSLQVHPRQAGVLGYILLNSSTLGDALRNLQRYHHVLSDGWELEFEIDEVTAVLRARMVDPLVEDERQVAEGVTSLFLKTCELITQTETTPVRVEFRHDKPAHAQVIRERFGCPIRYGQDGVALVFRRAFLDYPVETADDELLKILKRHCRQILGTRPKANSFIFEVQKLITDRLMAGQPKIDTVARELGMSSRTLTRRLADDGVTYKALLDEVRRKLALQYMKDRRISPKQVAYLLGYSEVPAFYHAFRRWTGSSPLQHRLEG